MYILKTIASLDSSTGGPARSVPSLGEAISNTGAKVQLFVDSKKGDTGGSGRITSTFLSVNSIDNLGDTLKELKEKKGDSTIVHNHGIWLPFNHHVSASVKRYSTPLVISTRGMLEPWARSYRSWKKTLAWNLYQRSDLKAASALHATSEQEAKNLQILGFKIPIVVIPNGVEIPEKAESAGRDEHTKTALFLSRVHPKKGLITLVQAWAQVRPANWQVLIAGPDEGGHLGDVEQEIQRHGLTDVFHHIGQVADQDKWALYSNADLFVFPTHSENFGIVVAEALASGVPVITTKGAPWAELEEYKCGWWTEIGVEPFAKAIDEATNLSRESRQAMGRRGQRLVEQNYSWNKIGKDMVLVYAWILGRGAKPNCVVTD